MKTTFLLFLPTFPDSLELHLGCQCGIVNTVHHVALALIPSVLALIIKHAIAQQPPPPFPPPPPTPFQHPGHFLRNISLTETSIALDYWSLRAGTLFSSKCYSVEKAWLSLLLPRIFPCYFMILYDKYFGKLFSALCVVVFPEIIQIFPNFVISWYMTKDSEVHFKNCLLIDTCTTSSSFYSLIGLVGVVVASYTGGP